jgi:hypothetical protein
MSAVTIMKSANIVYPGGCVRAHWTPDPGITEATISWRAPDRSTGSQALLRSSVGFFWWDFDIPSTRAAVGTWRFRFDAAGDGEAGYFRVAHSAFVR